MEIGTTYYRLTVVGPTFLVKGRRYVPVKCVCGKEWNSRLDAVVKGMTKSCGCLRKEQNRVANLSHGMGRVGINRHPIYHTWSDMVQRVTNPNNPAYHHYGGRGITVQESWLKFEGFLADMGANWFAGGTLEREDTNAGYCRANCRWATQAEQTANTRRSLVFDYNGELRSMQEIAKLAGVPLHKLRYRLSYFRMTAVAAVQAIKQSVRLPKPERRSMLDNRRYK